MQPVIKVCGITRAEDAEQAIDAGATALGFNLWPQSPRAVTLAGACALAELVRGRVAIVSVTVDATLAELQEIDAALRPDRLQLHGGARDLAARVARAYHAVGLSSPADVAQACAAPGEWVLVDARDNVRRGGTGRAAPRPLAAQVCAARATILAGGLEPANVAAAIRALRPRGVDAASRLEVRPGVKDPERVREFVRAAAAAFAALAEEEHVRGET